MSVDDHLRMLECTLLWSVCIHRRNVFFVVRQFRQKQMRTIYGIMLVDIKEEDATYIRLEWSVNSKVVLMNTFELNRLKKTAIDDLTTDETSSQHTRRRILKIDNIKQTMQYQYNTAKRYKHCNTWFHSNLSVDDEYLLSNVGNIYNWFSWIIIRISLFTMIIRTTYYINK